jgi:WD40-like Beta Propeller Repeat
MTDRERKNPTATCALRNRVAASPAVVGAFAAVCTVTLAACSGGHGTPVVSTSKTVASAPVSGPSDAVGPGQKHSGVALVDCTAHDPTTVKISFLRPETGQSTGNLSIVAQLSGGPTGQLQADLSCQQGDGADRLRMREQFDTDLGRVAVTTSKLPDGSQHVGYVDLATKQFTDVSGTAGAAFSSNPPVDSNPVFSPSRPELWFLRDGRDIYSTDLNGGNLTKRSSPPMPQSGGNPGFLVEGGTDQPISDGLRQFDVLPNPTGTIAVAARPGQIDTQQGGGIRIFTNPADTFAPLDTNFDSTKGSATVLTGVGACVPEAWVDEASLLCSSSTSPPDLMITPITRGSSSATATALLPPNHRNSYSPVVSPDRSTIAFLSRGQGTTTTLWVTSTKPGSEPRKVIDLPESGFARTLLGWY